MSRQAFQISTALLFSTVVLLATALGSNAQSYPGPALPAPALAGVSFTSRLKPVEQIATSSALPNAIAVLFTNSTTPIYSANGGATWQSIPVGPWPSGSALKAALAPRGDTALPVRLIVAAAGKIYRTGDYGQNWSQVTLPLPPDPEVPSSGCGTARELVVSPVDPNRLYTQYTYPSFSAGEKHCVYTSGDAGLNWQLIHHGKFYASRIVPSPVLAGQVYVGNKRSDNVGGTWTDLPWSSSDLLALDANNPNSLYRVSLNDVGGPDQGSRSTDGGSTWSPWTQQPCQQYFQLMAHPVLSNELFLRCTVGVSGLLVSHYSGDSWQPVGPVGELLVPDYSRPGRLLWARGDGLWASSDEGSHWTNLTPDYIGPLPVGWRSRAEAKPRGPYGWGCDTCSLWSAAAISQSDAWAIGDWGVIEHWDGNAWSQMKVTDSALHGISMVSANDGWAVGQLGTVLHWNGSAWSQVDSPVLGDLNSVDMASATDGWAVGDDSSYGPPANILLRWNGSTWTRVPNSVNVPLYSVLMLSANDGWAVGWSDNPLTTAILRWNGTTWTQVDSGMCTWPSSLAGVATDDVWAVGFGQICHWNGNTWSALNVPNPDEHLLSIATLSLSDGWAVGENGRILHWNGSIWADLPRRPTNRALIGVTMLDANHGWIVGENGIILDRVTSSYLPNLVK